MAALSPTNAVFDVIRLIHYVYPSAFLVWFVGSQVITMCTLASRTAPQRDHRKRLFIMLQLAVIVSYVGEAALMCLRSLAESGWWSSSDNVVYLLMSIMLWGSMELVLLDTRNPTWYPYYGSWLLSMVAEVSLFGLSLATNKAPNNFEIARLCVEGSRLLMFLVLPLGLWAVWGQDPDDPIGEESARLLCSEDGQASPSIYGSVSDSDGVADDGEAEAMRKAKERMLKKIEESGSWWAYAKSFSIFWPYVWPQGDRWLQFTMFLVGLCLLAGRGLNVLVPHQLGVVTNSLMDAGGRIPWVQLTFYVALRWLDSASGVEALQNFLWMPIEQYSYRSLTGAAYNHVMSLSYDFHSNKQTGDVWSSIAQGRAVNGFVETILFQVFPMLADLLVAFAYFFIVFGTYMALIVGSVMVVYLYATFKLSIARNSTRRELNNAGKNEVSILIETVSSWATVSYFNRISYEQNRFRGAINLYQKAERKWLIGISVLNVGQSLIFMVGLLAACFYAVYQVTTGVQPVGSFVTLLSYWAQLSAPLSFFANFYRRVQTQMLDAERLLELFQTESAVRDDPRALVLDKLEGTIDFENVCFSYDSRKPAITDVSLHVPAGKSVAFVGETGGGKTTCLKLLFRFYDVASGAIKIDGHDIRDIKLSSLREHIGVVPQDPQLFNDTIMNNIKYANFDATDEDVYEACRAASIHEKILTFPDAYNSKVGERGVKLSGGELQRVSIARAILKNPKIILLDEATSMIDMETERQIQGALRKLGTDRTMFIVAHRLSTIMGADLIVVIKEGKIIEKGTHEELMQFEGKYFQLWSTQSNRDESVPKSESKEPRLLEDLFDPLHSDNAPKNGEDSSSRQIEIPESSKRAASSRPAVTFSLPGRTVWYPEYQFHPLQNPRISAPNHGILKNASPVQAPVVTPENVDSSAKTGSSSSVLKPDAKEFVPKRLSIIAHDWTPPQATSESQVLAVEAPSTVPSNETHSGDALEVPIVTKEEPSSEIPQAIQVETDTRLTPVEPAFNLDYPSPEIPSTETITDRHEYPETGHEDMENVDPDIDNPQDTKKRRRRTRRRSHKMRSGGHDDNLGVKQGSSAEASGAELLVPGLTSSSSATEDEPSSPIDGEGEGKAGATNDIVGKGKRRLRSNSYKQNATCLDPGNEGGPLSTVAHPENVGRLTKHKARTNPATKGGTRNSGKEDQGLTENSSPSNTVSSAIKEEAPQAQHRSSGSQKGSWRKANRKPTKSTESGYSTSEA